MCVWGGGRACTSGRNGAPRAAATRCLRTRATWVRAWVRNSQSVTGPQEYSHPFNVDGAHPSAWSFDVARFERLVASGVWK